MKEESSRQKVEGRRQEAEGVWIAKTAKRTKIAKRGAGEVEREARDMRRKE